MSGRGALHLRKISVDSGKLDILAVCTGSEDDFRLKLMGQCGGPKARATFSLSHEVHCTID